MNIQNSEKEKQFLKNVHFCEKKPPAFLAHLAHSARVSFWDSAMSVVVRLESWVINNLLQNYCAESNENLSEASLWWGTQTIRTEFDFIIVPVAMATERKKTKQILKNLLLQNYWSDSFETLSEASV